MKFHFASVKQKRATAFTRLPKVFGCELSAQYHITGRGKVGGCLYSCRTAGYPSSCDTVVYPHLPVLVNILVAAGGIVGIIIAAGLFLDRLCIFARLAGGCCGSGCYCGSGYTRGVLGNGSGFVVCFLGGRGNGRLSSSSESVNR